MKIQCSILTKVISVRSLFISVVAVNSRLRTLENIWMVYDLQKNIFSNDGLNS